MITEIDIRDRHVTLLMNKIEKLQKQNEIMKEALGDLVFHCEDYGLKEESLAILMACEKAMEALAAAREIK